MTFDPTKPVRTTDGCKARILCTDRENERYPLLVLVTGDLGGETAHCYMSNGEYADNKFMPSLVNVPEKGYIFIWRDGKDKARCCYGPFATAEAANRVVHDLGLEEKGHTVLVQEVELPR